MEPYCLFRSAAMAFAVNQDDFSPRRLKVANTIPEFGLLVKPLIDSPGNATAFWTPDVSSQCQTSYELHLRCDRASRHSATGENTNILILRGTILSDARESKSSAR